MKSFIYRIFSEKRYIFTHMGTLKLGIIAQKSRRLRPQERSVFENFTWQQHQLPHHHVQVRGRRLRPRRDGPLVNLKRPSLLLRGGFSRSTYHLAYMLLFSCVLTFGANSRRSEYLH